MEAENKLKPLWTFIGGGLISFLMSAICILLFATTTRLLGSVITFENMSLFQLSSMIRIIVFGIPLVIGICMLIIKRREEDKKLFWIGVVVTQLVIALTINPNFQM